MTSGTWNHLAITHDGSSTKIYLNGTLETVTGTNSAYWTDDLAIIRVYLGTGFWTPSHYQGSMDEIKLFQGVMTAGDVAREYCNGLGGGKKVAECTFDSSEEEYLIFSTDVNSDGKVCNSAEFNGTDQYVRLTPDSAISSATGTIQFWFKSTPNSTADLIEIRETNYTDFLLVRTYSDNTVNTNSLSIIDFS